MSHPSFHRHGSSEARLCRMADRARTEGVSGWADRVSTGIEDMFSGINADEKTRKRMDNKSEMLSAFRLPAILTKDQTQNPPDHPFGPKEFLESLPLPERTLLFVRFVRSMIPKDVRNKHPIFQKPFGANGFNGFKGFDDLFTTNDLDTYLQGKPPLPVLPSDLVEKLLDAQALMLGRDPRNTALAMLGAGALGVMKTTALDIAQASLSDIYPDTGPGRLYHDYRVAVRYLQQNLAAPIHDQLKSRDFLLANLPECTFKGWLHITPANESQLVLDKFSTELDKEKAEKDVVMHQSANELNDMNNGNRIEANRQYRTMGQMFDRMSPEVKLAMCAAGVWALWKMYKGENFFWKWGVRMPVAAVVGVMGYQYFVKGNEKAVPNTLSFVQGWARAGGEAVEGVVRGRSFEPNNTDLLRGQITMLARFLDEKAFLKMRPEMVGMVTLSEMPLGTIARHFAPAAAPGKLVGGIIADRQGGELDTQMRGIIKKRDYDAQKVYEAIYQHNGPISEGVSVLLYHIGANEPGNAAAKERVEMARSGHGADASYEKLVGSDAEKDFRALMMRGKWLAENRYGKMTVAEAFSHITLSTL